MLPGTLRKTAYLDSFLELTVDTPLGEVFPSVLGGFIMAGVGMVVGSLAPTAGNTAHHAEGRHKRLHGVPAHTRHAAR